MSIKPIYFLITFDVCSTFNIIPEAITKITTWRDNIQKQIVDDKVKFTWFVRCDNQLETEFGNSNYLLDKYKKTWDRLEIQGDEIAWHPHIYRNLNGNWILETRDEILERHLLHYYDKFIDYYNISSVRMGESFHSNHCMKVLDVLRIKVDSTAIPNRKRNDNECFFDWTGTPDYPYHPSMDDYRKPGSNPLDILEVPMSTIPIRTDYDLEFLKRYVNLSFHNHLMTSGFQTLIRNSRIIVTITHPFEILSLNSKKHSLLSFSIEEFDKNFKMLIELCIHEGIPYRFITMSEVPKFL